MNVGWDHISPLTLVVSDVSTGLCPSGKIRGVIVNSAIELARAPVMVWCSFSATIEGDSVRVSKGKARYRALNAKQPVHLIFATS